jgi:hypothetical protein
MRKSRFSEEKIIVFRKEVENGTVPPLRNWAARK